MSIMFSQLFVGQTRMCSAAVRLLQCQAQARSRQPIKSISLFSTSAFTSSLRSNWRQHGSVSQTMTASCRSFSLSTTNAADEKPQRVNVTFETSGGDTYEVFGYEGDSLYDVVLNRNVPLDGFGACEATLACSTCHVVLSEKDYDYVETELKNGPGDEEMDMLDLAYGLCDTSRLGCQIILCKEMDGLVVKVPEGTMDARLIS